MAQITVTFDKPKNPALVCDVLRAYLEQVEEWKRASIDDGVSFEDREVYSEVYDTLDRLIGNLQE